jgi:Fic family protein
MKHYYKWKPIVDLPDQLKTLSNSKLKFLSDVWAERKQALVPELRRDFMEQLNREWAIETGQIEGLYQLDRGLTKTLIDNGLETIRLPDGTDKIPPNTGRLLASQKNVIDELFKFVKLGEPISNFYIRSLHGEMTKEQQYCESIDCLGNHFKTTLLKGTFKILPNNPTSIDGSIQEYCPPEHVQSEMDNLIKWHLEHQRKGVAPEIESAWLHHRFIQIHPFQDGNGRIARALATMVFLQAGWFPLIVNSDKRILYIRALDKADQGDLGGLINLFSDIAIRTFRKALENLPNKL